MLVDLDTHGQPSDITLVVGELRNRGRYNAVDGVSAATLVELFRRRLWFATCRSTFPVFWKSPADDV